MIKNHGHTTARRLQARYRVCALGAFALAAIAPLVPVVKAQESAHAKELGQKLMCVCGCNQILGSCNHVGCSYSHEMMKEVEDRVARNEPDDLTLQAFVQEYGPTVLSSPPGEGIQPDCVDCSNCLSASGAGALVGRGTPLEKEGRCGDCFGAACFGGSDCACAARI